MLTHLKDFVGAADGNVHQFYGIPFAKPPYVTLVSFNFRSIVTVRSTGDRRFRLPEAIDPYTGTYDATKQGLACPQQAVKLPLLPDGVVGDAINFAVNKVYGAIDGPDGEDCMRRFSLVTVTLLTQGIRSKLEHRYACKR